MWVDLCLNCFWYTHGTSANFKVDFNNAISGLQFWIVAEVCTRLLSTWRFPTQIQSKAHDCDLSALDAQVKSTMDELEKFKPVLECLGLASDGVEMSIEIGKTINTVNHTWKAQMPVIWLEAAQSYSKHSVFLYWCCIQGGFPSIFDVNDMIDEIASISRTKKNLMNQWKVSQRTSKSWPVSSTDSKELRARTNCARQ